MCGLMFLSWFHLLTTAPMKGWLKALLPFHFSTYHSKHSCSLFLSLLNGTSVLYVSPVEKLHSYNFGFHRSFVIHQIWHISFIDVMKSSRNIWKHTTIISATFFFPLSYSHAYKHSFLLNGPSRSASAVNRGNS